MKIGKIFGGIAVGALLVSLIPYRVQKDEETGAMEIRSLLWVLKKTPRKEGEEKDHYAFALPPSGLARAEALMAETH